MDIIGFVEYLDIREVRGWAFMPDAPDEKLAITVMLEELVVAAGVADRQRGDLEVHGYGNGNHAFAVPLTIPVSRNDLMLLEVFAESELGGRVHLEYAEELALVGDAPPIGGSPPPREPPPEAAAPGSGSVLARLRELSAGGQSSPAAGDTVLQILAELETEAADQPARAGQQTPAKPAARPRALPDPGLRNACTRFLGGHGKLDAKDWVARLATACADNAALDVYSEGPAMARLEAEVAAMLGKEAGLFFHKGVTAQQAALLVHAEATGRKLVALHPKSHLARDESDALDRLSGLITRRIGKDHAPFTAADLAATAEPLAAVTVELPLRRAGFLATPWDELAAISDWARRRGIPFHLDGARLWEVAPWYGRSLADIAALADTVYVSFYKGLGGMGGCVLAGPADVIAAAKPWRNRFGGDLPTIFPYVATALDGLTRHLPHMPDYHRHATAVAAALADTPGIRPLTRVPHGNSFQIHFDVPAEALEHAIAARARADGTWLFNRVEETAFPDHCFTELVVGDATLPWRPADVAAALTDLRARAREAT